MLGYDMFFIFKDICMIPSFDWKINVTSSQEQDLIYNISKAGRKSAKNKRETDQRRKTRMMKLIYIAIFIFTCQYDDVTSITLVKWHMK